MFCQLFGSLGSIILMTHSGPQSAYRLRTTANWRQVNRYNAFKVNFVYNTDPNFLYVIPLLAYSLSTTSSRWNVLWDCRSATIASQWRRQKMHLLLYDSSSSCKNLLESTGGRDGGRNNMTAYCKLREEEKGGREIAHVPETNAACHWV